LSPLAAAAQTGTPAPAPTPPQATAPPPSAQSREEQQKREAWRKSMSQHPVPKNGCFNASYPNTEWQEVPCGRPSPYPNLVGNGNDFAAQTSGVISSAVGSFLTIPNL